MSADRPAPAAAVWLLAATESDLIDDSERNAPLKIRETKLLKPRHVSRRIAAQDGWFSVHRGMPDGLGLKYVSLDPCQRFAACRGTHESHAFLGNPSRAEPCITRLDASAESSDGQGMEIHSVRRL